MDRLCEAACWCQQAGGRLQVLGQRCLCDLVLQAQLPHQEVNEAKLGKLLPHLKAVRLCQCLQDLQLSKSLKE